MTGHDGGGTEGPGFEPLGFESLAIHAGQPPDPSTGAVVTPIFQTSTYAQSGVGQHLGYDYSRTANPTRNALQQCLAALEGASHGLAFASGMAAADALLRQLKPRDHLLIPDDAYGGTYRLVSGIHALSGVGFSPVATHDLAALERGFTENTRMVWVESPSNPLLRVIDIAAVAEIAHRHGAMLVVDNTFATPYLQQPLTLGADAVVHSTTKYLGGHSDVVGGFIATSDDDLAVRLAFVQNSAGAVPGPFDCFLVLRGIKTLALRMERHCTNAEAVVELLASHPGIDHVYYPGLAAHPGHDIAARQMRRFGGMVSFTLRQGEEAALAVAGATRLFTLAESLGAVESLIEHPHRMTHASVVGSPLAVDPALIRLSVGIETLEDLLRDLSRALEPFA
jgi:cystathionine gamma-synthase